MVDRLTTLRGSARSILDATMGSMASRESGSAVVKTSGKTEKQEIDLQQKNNVYKEELVKMGDSVELNSFPNTIRQIQQQESEQFKKIDTRFRALSSASAPRADDVSGFRKDAERFSATLEEDMFIVRSLQGKTDRALAAGNLPASKKALHVDYMKMAVDCQKALQKYRSETVRFLGFKFR